MEDNIDVLYQRIRSRRKELGMSQEELAEKVGYKTKSSINKIELGQNDIAQSKIYEFAKALRTTPAYLMGWEDTPKDDHFTIPNIYPIGKKKFPLLGNVACGQPILATENFEGYIESGSNIHADFCLKAKGDSMVNARILDGDIVFIRKQDMVENGEIAAVLIDDEATLKRFYMSNDIIQLNAENPSYAPQIYKKEDLNGIRILGKAIAFQSDVI